MRKTTLSISILVALLALSGPFFCHPAMASNIQSNLYDTYCRTPILEQFGEIDRNQTIIIDNVENPLYCTFENNEAALEKLHEAVPEILEEISSEFSLEKLNSTNWEYYKYGALNLPTTSQFSSDNNLQKQTLNEFFDIYENKEKNDTIKAIVNAPSTHSASQSTTFDLGMMLPTYAPLAQQSENMIKVQNQIMPFALPNIEAAVSYAERYAVNPNKDGYGIAKGGITKLWADMDCTNFVSQILEASGVGQAVYSSDTMGWWHKKNGSNHTYSVSWINSDTFARYMGVGYSTTNHKDFANNIARGDFISLDHTNDGSWDHMGFVTAIGNELCYETGVYRNYKVAQHTSNYHEWANDTNWPKGVKFGRVRR